MTPDGDHKWKIEIFRDRLRHSLSARYLLRFHVGLILLFSVLVGWGVDVLLLKMGSTRMAWRYSAAILFAYGAFYLGVYAWIELSGIRDYVERKRADLLVGEDVPQRPAAGEQSKEWSWLDGADPTMGCYVDAEGCGIVIIFFVALAALFYFFGGYVIANALTFFADIVLELLLAAGLLRGINRYEASGWMVSVWRHTRWSLAFALFAAIVLGWLAQAYYPQARTLPEVVKLWHR